MRNEQADRLNAKVKNLEELTDKLEIQMSWATIEKKLAKKNLELEEVRVFRKKLNKKEKEICVAIEKFEVTSESVLQMLSALRENPLIETE